MKQVFINGNIYQGSRDQWGRAILVEDGIIKEVFDQDMVGVEGVERVDLEGGWVLPGFEDAHTHPGSRCRMLVELDARSAKDWGQAQALISQYLRTHAHRELIVVHGWNQASWGTLRQDQLDDLTDKPLIVINVSYHGAVVNRAAQEWLMTRIDGIRIEEGVVEESDFVRVATQTLPAYEELLELIPAYQRFLAHMGTTGVHDLHLASEDQLRAYQALAQNRTLPLFTAAYINPCLIDSPILTELLARPHDRFFVAGVKLFLDGAIGMHTARVFEAYQDTGTHGVLLYSHEEARKVIDRALQRGFTSVAVHAIGDEAVARTLDLYEAVHASGHDVTGWRIEHAEMIRPEDIPRMSALGVIPVLQPNFHWDLEHYTDRLSQMQMQRINPFADLLKAKIPLVFGSDGMPEGPLIGLDYALNKSIFPQQKIDLEQAIDAYCAAGPRLVRSENRGELAVGKLFNAVQLHENPFHTRSLRDMKVERTWVAGEEQ